jgi:hypothetical protein
VVDVSGQFAELLAVQVLARCLQHALGPEQVDVSPVLIQRVLVTALDMLRVLPYAHRVRQSLHRSVDGIASAEVAMCPLQRIMFHLIVQSVTLLDQ